MSLFNKLFLCVLCVRQALCGALVNEIRLFLDFMKQGFLERQVLNIHTNECVTNYKLQFNSIRKTSYELKENKWGDLI